MVNCYAINLRHKQFLLYTFIAIFFSQKIDNRTFIVPHRFCCAVFLFLCSSKIIFISLHIYSMSINNSIAYVFCSFSGCSFPFLTQYDQIECKKLYIFLKKSIDLLSILKYGWFWRKYHGLLKIIYIYIPCSWIECSKSTCHGSDLRCPYLWCFFDNSSCGWPRTCQEWDNIVIHYYWVEVNLCLYIP